MSNKILILPQLDKLEKHHLDGRQIERDGLRPMCGCTDWRCAYLHAIEQFRLMLEGVDVTVGLEIDDET